MEKYHCPSHLCYLEKLVLKKLRCCCYCFLSCQLKLSVTLHSICLFLILTFCLFVCFYLQHKLFRTRNHSFVRIYLCCNYVVQVFYMFSFSISHILSVTVFLLHQYITSLKLGLSSMNRNSKAFNYTTDRLRENERRGRKMHPAYTS